MSSIAKDGFLVRNGRLQGLLGDADGSPEVGAPEIGFIENDLVEIGAGKFGVSKICFCEVHLRQRGVLHPDLLKVGLDETALREVLAGQLCRLEVDAVEHGLMEVRILKVYAPEVGTSEGGFAQVDASEGGFLQEGVGQIGFAEVGEFQVGWSEVDSA